MAIADVGEEAANACSHRVGEQNGASDLGVNGGVKTGHAAALRPKSTPVALDVVEGAWSALVTDRRADRLPADDPPEVPSSS